MFSSREDQDAEEAEPDAGEPAPGDVLVVDEGRGDDEGEEGRGRLEDPGQPRVDVLLGPADEPERDRDVDGTQDGKVSEGAGVARQRRPRHGHDDEQDRDADEDAQQDEAQRRERLDADLDEEVAAAPHEGQRAQQDGVAGGRARLGRRGRSSAFVGGSGSSVTGGVWHAQGVPVGPATPGPRRPPGRPWVRRREWAGSVPWTAACVPFAPSSCSTERPSASSTPSSP